MTDTTCGLWVANWDLDEAGAAALLGAGPVVTMVDSTGADAGNIPTSAVKVAGYGTGGGGIQWPTPAWDRFSDKTTGKVVINQDPASSPLTGDILDSEPGAWTIAGAAAAMATRRGHGRQAQVYVSAGNQAALEEALRGQGFTDFPVVAVQWASPSSNPGTILPGTSMSLREANVDLSAALASWFAPSAAPPPPSRGPYRHQVPVGNTMTLEQLAASRGVSVAFLVAYTHDCGDLDAQNGAVLNAFTALDSALSAVGEPHPVMPAGLVYYTANP